MENLKKVLKFNGTENTDSMSLQHEDFLNQYLEGNVNYRLPKRYINIFYRLPIDKWRQVIVQISLLMMWACPIIGM